MITTKKDRKIDKLIGYLRNKYRNHKLTPENINLLGEDIRLFLSLGPISSPAIKRTLLDYMHSTLTTSKIIEISRKMVGGKSLLEDGKSISEASLDKGYYEVRCINVEIKVEPFPHVNLSLKFTEGPLTEEVKVFRAKPWKIQKLGHVVGLRERGKIRRYHPRELFGLLFKVYISNSGELKGFGVTQYQKRKNSELRRERRNNDCNKRCIYCSLGKSQCEFATHNEEWEKGECSNGHTSFFNKRKECLFCKEEVFKRKADIISFDEGDFF